MKCEYCGTENNKDTERCKACNAPLSVKSKDTWKSEPFFYNGYICYMLKYYPRDEYEVQFWLGRELIERIVVTRPVLDQRIPQGCDYMPFFWDLFLLAHGEKEVIEWQEKNKKYPATFLITRVENPERERIRTLSLRDLAMESRR